jgi:hypothetical protein
MEIEARHWFSRPRNGQVLIIVSSSDCKTWEEIRDHLLPPALGSNLASEPLWVPLQHHRNEIFANPNAHQIRGELIEDLKQVLPRFYPTRDWGQLRGEERSRRRRAIGILSGLALLFLALAVAAVGFARYAQKQRVAAEERLAENYWQNSRSARTAGENLGALHFAAEAIRLEPSLLETLLLDVREIHPSLLIAMVTHQGSVNNAQFSHDDSRILTCSSDKTARLWDARTGLQIGPALQHQGAVTGARFSRDESRILTWSWDQTARLWDARTGQQIGPALQHQDVVSGAQFSRDESRILTSSWDNTAPLWDARTGQQIGPVLQHQGSINGARFSRDESRILTWSLDKTARLWDARTGQQIGPALQHQGAVSGAKFSQDESYPEAAIGHQEPKRKLSVQKNLSER